MSSPYLFLARIGNEIKELSSSQFHVRKNVGFNESQSFGRCAIPYSPSALQEGVALSSVKPASQWCPTGNLLGEDSVYTGFTKLNALTSDLIILDSFLSFTAPLRNHLDSLFKHTQNLTTSCHFLYYHADSATISFLDNSRSSHWPSCVHRFPTWHILRTATRLTR